MLNEPVEGTEQGLARLLGLGVAPCRAAGGLSDRFLAEHGLPSLEAGHNDLLVSEGRGRDEASVHFRIREHLKKEGVILEGTSMSRFMEICPFGLYPIPKMSLLFF